MTAHGLGSWPGQYGLLNLLIPDFILSCAGGGIVGALSGSRWLSRAIVYSLVYCAAPYIETWIPFALESALGGGSVFFQVLM